MQWIAVDAIEPNDPFLGAMMDKLNLLRAKASALGFSMEHAG
jgi:hypothetical protein